MLAAGLWKWANQSAFRCDNDKKGSRLALAELCKLLGFASDHVATGMYLPGKESEIQYLWRVCLYCLLEYKIKHIQKLNILRWQAVKGLKATESRLDRSLVQTL